MKIIYSMIINFTSKSKAASVALLRSPSCACACFIKESVKNVRILRSDRPFTTNKDWNRNIEGRQPLYAYNQLHVYGEESFKGSEHIPLLQSVHRAEPSRAEPSRAEPSRAKPSRCTRPNFV